MSKTHASSFAGYNVTAALLGEAVEKYEPLCGTYADDPCLTHEDGEVTCNRCLGMLALVRDRE